MLIEYLTHASLSIRTAGCKLLTDPFYFLEPHEAMVMMHYPPRAFEPADFGRVDFVYSSHIHPDHSHPPTLRKLRDRIQTVLLPSERPELEQRYRDIGFTDIVLLENGVAERVHPDLRVTAYWSDPVDSALVIEAEDVTVLHLNDCILDEATIQTLGRRHRFDFAFVQYTSAQNLFPLLLKRPDDELARLCSRREERLLARQIRLIDVIKPAVVVPYAMTMTYVQPEQIHYNGHGRFTPTTFRDRLRAERPNVDCWLLSPGAIIDAAARRVDTNSTADAWGRDLNGYLRAVTAYSRSLGDALSQLPRGWIEGVDELLLDRLARSSRSPGLTGSVAFHIVSETRSHTCLVDFDAQRARPVGAFAGAALEINAPAVLTHLLLCGHIDPYAALFSYLVGFDWHGAPFDTEEDEVDYYIATFVGLFDPGGSSGAQHCDGQRSAAETLHG